MPISKTSPPAPAAGQPIPTPADFPVAWENPGDAKITWMVNTRPIAPMAPLTYSIAAAFTVGGNPGYERTGLPFRMRVARINTYEYLGAEMTAAPPEAVMKAMGFINRAAPGLFKMMMGKMAAGMTHQQLEAVNPIIERFEAYLRSDR
jgi:hypothetical protein